MRVKVSFFAAHRDIAGRDDLDLEVPEPASVDAAASLLEQRWPALCPLLRRSRAAVNEEYVSFSHPLAAGDRLAFIPPVSGG